MKNQNGLLKAAGFRIQNDFTLKYFRYKLKQTYFNHTIKIINLTFIILAVASRNA